MALEIYRKKRKFNVTPEPRGRASRKKGHQFVIQKHAARRLHYDFRLELDGVMKSWAVTRGPSLVPTEKRLAVETEDHPIEYNSFEGTIPEGEYGGGTVMIWDRGTWTPLEDPHRGLKKGHLSFALDGEKLHGAWHLVRLRGRPGEKRNNWLLIKSNDEAARTERDKDILEEMPLSAVTGRSIPEIAEGKGRKRVWHSNRSAKDNVKAGATRGASAPAAPAKQKGARSPHRERTARKNVGRKKKAAHLVRLPDFIPPSLATLREKPPSGPGWVHEIKFDGYRMQARLDHGEVKLLTRKGLDWTTKFPNIATDVAQLPTDAALIDGEIVVEDGNGISNFSMLQAALKDGEQERFRYYVFDLFHLDGEDLIRQPLVERKAALKELLEQANSTGAISYSEHFEEDGQVVWQQACNMQLEGILSKRADVPYVSGRSDTFIKVKCATAQEFVVGGYSPSTSMPHAIGALVAGYYRDGKLIYAGRIGTGYTHAVARGLWKQLHPLEIARPPFDEMPPEEARRRDVKWVEPKLVIELHFRGWTGDNLVRQAAFKGVREDKPPKEVVREVAAATESDDRVASADVRAQSRVAAEASEIMAKKSKRVATVASKSKNKAARPARKAATSDKQDKDERCPLHPSRPRVLARRRRHQAGPRRLLPLGVGVDGAASGEPATQPACVVRRAPRASASSRSTPPPVSTIPVCAALSISKRRQVIAVEDLDGLLSLVQAGILEVHVRGSMIDRLDLCDRIVFDIDPGDGVTWAGIVAAAREVRERLAAIDLESFVKLSGGKGVHVVLPIVGTEWATVKTFVQAFAQAMAADAPDRYLAKMTKSLRKGKIFIDYLRNSLEQTSVGAFSTRAREGAPVSAPVTWDELGRAKSANQYTVLNIAKRLSSLKADPWKDIGRVKQRLPDLATLRRRR